MNEDEEFYNYNSNKKLNKTKIISTALIISLSLVITVVVLFCIYFVAKTTLDDTASINRLDANSEFISAITEAVDMINEKYIDIYDVSEDEMLDNVISSIASSVGDPYTRYVTEEEYNEMLTSGTEQYGGLGIHLTYDIEMDAMIILSVMPNSPALESGLQIGDYIIQVEDTVVNLENYTECVNTMKGEEGTSVDIVISRNGEIIEKSVTRKIIQVNNVESEILEGNIGYIKIVQFENDICNQFKTEYEKLLSQNITGLVIDVRNNPGGLVSETVKILDILLPKGEVLKLVYKDGSQKVYKCSDNKQIEIPLAVITNGSSASAAEILASAVKDSNKGVVIGTKTYGKGIVQEIEKLSYRGALSITVAKYYTASGVEINKNGIEPNIVVELPEELKNKTVLAKDKDLQLQRAIQYINEN